MQLVDPESAQFSELRLTRDGSVCGLINAKNSFGGYVGFKPFYYLSEEASKDDEKNRMGWSYIADKPAYTVFVRRICRDEEP